MKTSVHVLLFSLLAFASSALSAPNEHAEDELFWSQASALLPAFSGEPAAPTLSTRAGKWGAVLPWTHTPVTIATLPNGKLLTFAGQEPTYWPGTKTQTHWALWNPATGQFENQLYSQHEMFCAHPVMRSDGVLQTMGGRYTVRDTSTYDWRTNRWQRVGNMNDPRWYTTSVALPDGDVTTFGGQGGPNTAERYSRSTELWSRLAGIDWRPVSTSAGFAAQNWPFIMVAPDGRLFHFGPTDAMHWLAVDGSGSRTPAGLTVPGTNYPKDGAIVMYDSGKYLIAGGAATPNSAVASRECYTVDLNATPPIVLRTQPMAFARSHHNLVALPSGEVLVIGGNTTGERFSDNGSVLAAEVWNPSTRAWRTLSSMATPRNYHSTAALLPDGRVFSGGGGFAPGDPNHPSTHTNAELFTPPALLSSSNQPLTRPNLTVTPEAISLGSVFPVSATAGLNRFVMIRMMATTHGNTSDQRFLNIPFTEVSDGTYQLVSNPKKNVMVPGYWMLFGVKANGAYSEAKIIHVKEASDASNSGLTGRYYDGINFDVLKETRTDFTIDFDYSGTSPFPAQLGNSNYSIRWTGWVTPDYSESYTFYTNSDDGVRLWVDGVQLTNNWTAHGATEDSGTITLQAGVPVPITLEYFQGTGGSIIQLKWSSLRTPKSLIPARALSTSRNENEAFIAADNRHEFFVNGELVQVGVRWQEALRVAFESEGRATLAIHATDAGAVAGLIGHFTIDGEAVATSADWKVSPTAPSDWNQPGFDDSDWVNATDYGRAQTSPWLGGAAGLPVYSDARWIWTNDNVNDNEVFFRFTVGKIELADLPNQSNTTENAIDFQIGYTGEPAGNVTYSATGLPDGLTIQPSTGRITGSLTTSGVFNPVITISDDNGLADSQSFQWTVRLPGQGSGSLLLETWLNVGSATDASSSFLSNLTSNSRYPLSPDESAQITSFPISVNRGDYYGTRLRGFLHAPITGPYTFWLSTDNDGSLLLGTNSSPSSAVEVASIQGWAGVTEWTKYPSQKSATINLVAGEKYYLEILQKEANGGDHVNLAWTLPGDSNLSIVEGIHLSPWTTNQAPTMAAIADREDSVGTTVILQASATDPDGEALTYSASSLPAGLTLAANTGRITGVLATEGTYSVSVTATDPNGVSASESFAWTVNATLSLADPLSTPAEVGQDANFTLSPTGGTRVTYLWNFADGSPEVSTNSANVSHNYSQPGRYIVTVTASDANGTAVTKNFVHLAHPALNATRPVNSQPIIAITNGSQAQGWNVNPDQGTVTASDLTLGVRLSEIAVGQAPISLAEAPDGKIWVVNKSSHSLSLIDTTGLFVSQTILLPRGCEPHGLVFSPDGNSAWLAFEGTGEVALLNPATAALIARYPVGEHPRHLALSSDGSQLYVSRFISPPVTGEETGMVDVSNGGGFITVLNTTDPSSPSSIRLQASEESDFAGGSRGIPNYLGPLAISPAGDFGWIPSKQDNIERGVLRDGKQLNHENTIRSISSRVNLATGQEDYLGRIDHDNAGVPSSAIYGPYGLHVFVAIEGSREVAVIDAYGLQELFRFPTGLAPHGLALSPDGKSLLVHNFMERSVTVHDISGLIENGLLAVGTSTTIDPTENEALAPDVLLGKQLFYDAADDRLARENYMSCASCHNDGDHDGRTWDFTGFGEGLRNTIDLRGRGGEEHGPLHWSANFDEFQDFEGQIRNFAGGTGLIADGSPHASLGTPNGGRSADLDALAAYLGSLTEAPASPYRQEDATLTAEGQAGQLVFQNQGCADCHSGPAFTDSGLAFHDIGTLTAASGQRLGAPLPGLDTPSLLGVWDGAPYLHDGSALTLEEAISAHDSVSLNSAEMSHLVAYLNQIDGTVDAPLNQAPQLSTITNQTTAANMATSLQLSGTDANGDTLTFSAVGLPTGLSIDSSGLISGTATAAGSYSVLATISDGFETASQGFTWTITPGSQTSLAFGGTPANVPGRIEVENYDIGGPGVSFSDFDPENFGANFGPNFRDEGVDLEASNDTGGTPSIGWIENGEWAQYSINLTAGTYDLVARAASELAIPGSIRVLLDGVPQGEIDIASTGSWYFWEEFTLPNLTVTSGEAVLRLEFQGSSFNLNWLEFRTPNDNTPPPVASQTPFGGSPASIPGRIEAENFDEDGPGIAYLDTEEENYGLTYTNLNYRTSGVDIEASFDTNATPSIGWTDPGEWLEYTVNVSPGTYDLKARIASGFAFPGQLAVELDDRTLGVFSVEGTGDWYNWETLTIPQIDLTETGEHVLRLKFVGAAGFNLNWVEFDDGSTPPPPPSGQSPFGGVAHVIPGRVEAEDYDLGGEGIAYSDAEAENYGGNYRNDGVDIEPSGDTDGGFSVGWFDNAQWMEYTLATAPGIYQLNVRVSSAETIVGDVRVSLDGVELGLIDVQSTGAWTNWVTLSLPSIAIAGTGEKVLRLEMVGDAVNLNWFELLLTAPATNLNITTIDQVGAQVESTDDSDGDGSSNLAEFAFGSDISSSNSQPVLPLGFDHEGNCCQTVPVAVGGTLGRNTYTAAGLVYTFQGSVNLVDWDEAITFLPNPPSLPAPPTGYHYITYRLSDSSLENGYLRVLVTEE